MLIAMSAGTSMGPSPKMPSRNLRAASMIQWRSESSDVATLSSVGSVYQCGSRMFPLMSLWLPFLMAGLDIR